MIRRVATDKLLPHTDFHKFIKKLQKLKISDLPNIFSNPSYCIHVDCTYEDKFFHQKLLNINIFHSPYRESTKIIFAKNDIYHVIYYVFLVLGFHFRCQRCEIELKNTKVKFHMENGFSRIGVLFNYMDSLVQNCEYLEDMNELILRFETIEYCTSPDCSWSCEWFGGGLSVFRHTL